MPVSGLPWHPLVAANGNSIIWSFYYKMSCVWKIEINLDASFTSTSKKHFVGVVLLEEEEKLLTYLFFDICKVYT